jgi:uncharacterized iron-regulated membrane protein
VAFLDKPQSVWLRRALFQLHLWVGVITGVYIFIVCVSGAALVWRIDMQRATFPDLFTPSSGAAPADAATMLESVRKAFPSDSVAGIDAPTTTRPTYLAYVMRGSRFLTLLFDPVTGRLLGQLPDKSAVRVVQDLHFDLFAGRTGRIVNGIGAFCLVAMALTGFVIWWPGIGTWRRALTVDVSRSWRRINFDLHSAVGAWAGALVLMWAVTGIYFVWPQPFRAVVNSVSPITLSRAPASTAAAGAAKMPWRSLVEKAQTLVPGQHVARVVVPSSDRAAFLVMFSDVRPTPAGSPRLTSIYLDQYSGEVLQQAAVAGRTAGDVIMAWVAPLHVGNFGGNAVRVAWLVLGLTPAVLFVTGFIMWWTRVVRARWRGSSARAAAAAVVLAMLACAGTADALSSSFPPPTAGSRHSNDRHDPQIASVTACSLSSNVTGICMGARKGDKVPAVWRRSD